MQNHFADAVLTDPVLFGLSMHVDRGCSRDGLGCLTCNAACCPACAIVLESVAYCRRCAVALLDTETVQRTEAFDHR